MPHSKEVKSKIAKLYGNPTKSKPTKKQKKSDEEFLRIARERARDGAAYWKDNFDKGEEDLKFLAGDQWPENVLREREEEERPALTNNVLPTFCDQVLGDQRQNRPSIKISPVDTAHAPNQETGKDEELKISNRAGDKDYALAEVFTGAIRNIEYDCDAESAYDLAFQSSVEGAFGFLRVLTDYVNTEGFEQEISIKAIQNQFSVIMDPSAKEFDYSDKNWCFVDDTMLKEVFKKKYPNATPEPLNDITEEYSDWFNEKEVRISEYFKREEVIKEAVLLSDGKFVYLDEIEPILDELLEQGITVEKTRNVKTYKVSWCLISAFDILEGPIELDCTIIPIVPVWGKTTTIKKKTIYRSLHRHSHDAQRMSNYFDSAAAESVGLAPKAPFIGSEGHVEGREDEWENANTSNLSLLTFIPQYQGDRGPQRQQPSMVPSAEITLGMQATDKIKSTLGMFDASRGAQGNETSGKAIRERKSQANIGNFAFTDNLSKSIRLIGKILIELIPKVYDTERLMRLKFEDGSEDFVILNQQVLDDETNEYVMINDLNVAKYDVVVKVGPAYATQRDEAGESMVQFAQAVPAAAAVMADLIAINMDWPGSDILAERLKKIVPPEVLTEKEREEIAKDQPEQQTEPSPEQQLQMMELEIRGKEAEAKGVKAQSDIVKAEQDTIQEQLQTEAARMKLEQIEAGAQSGDPDYQVIKELIATALTELMAEQTN